MNQCESSTALNEGVRSHSDTVFALEGLHKKRAHHESSVEGQSESPRNPRDISIYLQDGLLPTYATWILQVVERARDLPPHVVPPTQIQQHTLGTLVSQLPTELIRRLDVIFFAFLMELCGNSNATDEKGELIHQTSMAKKLLQDGDGSMGPFLPLSFRIQPFTNAFSETLHQVGLLPQRSTPIHSDWRKGLPLGMVHGLSPRKIKVYLWNNRFIRRFNEEGKKTKTKGSHIWNVLVRKYETPCISPGHSFPWEFAPFERKITGNSMPPMIPGEPWSWEPKVWDPQIRSPRAMFSSNWLPDWMHWEDSFLKAFPPLNLSPGTMEMEIIGSYMVGDTRKYQFYFNRDFLKEPQLLCSVFFKEFLECSISVNFQFDIGFIYLRLFTLIC
jgi:hypothetical protein